MMTDRRAEEAYAALGTHPIVFYDVAATAAAPTSAAVVVAIDGSGAMPELDPALFDAMVTTRPYAAAPWVSVSPARFEFRCGAFKTAVANAPIAASVLARTLRIGARLAFDDALEVESLAYSTLFGGDEFGRWLGNRKTDRDPGSVPRVDYARERDVVTLTLDDPRAAMR